MLLESWLRIFSSVVGNPQKVTLAHDYDIIALQPPGLLTRNLTSKAAYTKVLSYCKQLSCDEHSVNRTAHIIVLSLPS